MRAPPTAAALVDTRISALSLRDDGVLLVTTDQVSTTWSDAQIRASWRESWPATHHAAAESLCLGTRSLSLGFLRSTCEHEGTEDSRPENCLATVRACTDMVKGWCR